MITTLPSDEIRAAAAAIANARANRRGAPAIVNVLELLETTPRLKQLAEEVLEEAAAAIEAVDRLRTQKRKPSTYRKPTGNTEA